MESIIRAIKRPLIVNDIRVNDINNIVNNIEEGAPVHIILEAEKVQLQEVQPTLLFPQDMRVNHKYIIKVKQYMTKQATPDFDFQSKWNSDVPMPFRIMKGTVLKETRGMVMMDCYAVPLKTDFCIRCGKALTHPVSRLYGIGPECGEHAHINPFNTEEELLSALDSVKDKLANIKWRGWIIKSAIEELTEIR